MRPLIARSTEALTGALQVPGDKSISHRALMLAGLAVGESRIAGLLEGEDVLRTAAAMRALGAELTREDDGRWCVWGCGVGGLAEPEQVLDLGNAGTAARLLMGLVAGQPMTAVLSGDASLVRRPMARVAEPLRQMGAQVAARQGCRLPAAVVGSAEPLAIRYVLPIASAQVKSAVLLAGLTAAGETCVVEPQPTRDHSERMLGHFGARLAVEEQTDGRAVRLMGEAELAAREVEVPADPSSAAFPAVAALLLPGSRLRLPGVGMNPHRTGLYATLAEMGARIAYENEREAAGEPLADVVLEAGPLAGVEVPAERAPAMIDEYPVLAVAAACAEGTTVMRGIGELRFKESDRLAGMARGLAACGVGVEEGEDSLVVHGCGGRPPGGATVEAALDHRIAMSFLVLGLAAERPVGVDDAGPIDTSFPRFVEAMRSVGADIAEGA